MGKIMTFDTKAKAQQLSQYVLENGTYSVLDDEYNARIEAELKARRKKVSLKSYNRPKNTYKKEKQIVDRKHPFWRAVFVRLNDALLAKGCDHSFDHVEQILFSLPNVDVGGTIDFYLENGWLCNCDVYFHVHKDEPKLKKA
jgi:hypothetical protein